MRLNPGFKTYWRHPGDSGVPPSFRFEGSRNLKSARVHFPAPRRFADGAGGFSIGYDGPEILLPLAITPVDPAKPVELVMEADYAVCEKMCVPASGKASLLLSADGKSPFHDALDVAMSRVP
jgi:DsbC/DsbD-like thiol-disulfide interchange protein